MKRVILCAVGLMALLGVALNAQSIAGTWQGRLPIAATGQGTGPESANPRIVFTIEKNADGSMHGVMALIDRGGSVPLTSVAFSVPNVTFTVGDMLNYHGKLSADGRSIAGSWTQGNQSLSLPLQLATAETLWKPDRPPPLPPMAANADPAFEVALIKPTGPDENNTLFDLRARKFSAQHTSAKELIKIAYNVRGRQVLGGPSWLEETKFDVVGEPDTEGLPSEQQNRVMVRKLLEERFHLVSHIDKQPFPVLALTLDPKGPRLTPSAPGLKNNGSMSSRRDGDDILLQFTGTTIPELIAFVMNTFQDKQLVDETGLTGVYDITLRIAGAAQGPMSSDDVGNALVLAAQHAGFKLVSKKEPLPVVVVDHIDLPTPN